MSTDNWPDTQTDRQTDSTTNGHAVKSCNNLDHSSFVSDLYNDVLRSFELLGASQDRPELTIG